MAMSSWQVATAAEAIVAGQFARFGYDVSVQYGANQPEYDLIVANGERLLKVSVKGSQDGSWGLSQKYLTHANYHAAASLWLARHKPLTALCLVQFKGVEATHLPGLYLAWPEEIAVRLKAASGGRGDTILYENYTRGPKAAGAGSTEALPVDWLLTPARIEHLFGSLPLPE